MNKVKAEIKPLDFTCKKCEQTVRSYLPKSIENKVCVRCRQNIIGRKLTAFE